MGGKVIMDNEQFRPQTDKVATCTHIHTNIYTNKQDILSVSYKNAR